MHGKMFIGKMKARLLGIVDNLTQCSDNSLYVCANFSCPDSMSSHVSKVILHNELYCKLYVWIINNTTSYEIPHIKVVY